jgi:hypothetical protein
MHVTIRLAVVYQDKAFKRETKKGADSSAPSLGGGGESSPAYHSERTTMLLLE